MTANSSALATAAQQRAHDTRHRAVDILRRLDAAGETVTFLSVARAARVSRSWLYRQADLRAEIDRLRTPRRRHHRPLRPTSLDRLAATPTRKLPRRDPTTQSGSTR